jgi:hypothetical protein
MIFHLVELNSASLPSFLDLDPMLTGCCQKRTAITTYGHAEDGLVALVNVTLGHVDGCKGRKLRNTKRGDGVECQETTGHFQRGWKEKKEEGEREGKGRKEK